MAVERRRRHPFRFLFKLALVVGVVTALSRLVASRRKDLYGLTESEARARLEAKLIPRLGEEKAAMVTGKVIPRLRDRGIIRMDPVEQPVVVSEAPAGGESGKVEEDSD